MCALTEGHEGECDFGKSVPAATKEQIEWWQGRELGEIPEGYGSGEFIDALIVLVEQEQATIEQLTIERDAALAINESNRDGVQLANATLNAGGEAYRELETTIETLEGSIEADRRGALQTVTTLEATIETLTETMMNIRDQREGYADKCEEHEATIKRLEKGCARNHVHIDRLCDGCKRKFRPLISAALAESEGSEMSE